MKILKNLFICLTVFILFMACPPTSKTSTLTVDLKNFSVVGDGFTDWSEFLLSFSAVLENANAEILQEEVANLTVTLYKEDNSKVKELLSETLSASKNVSVAIGKIAEAGNYRIEAIIKNPNGDVKKGESNLFKVDQNGTAIADFVLPGTGFYKGNTIEIDPTGSAYSNNLADTSVVFISADWKLFKVDASGTNWDISTDITLPVVNSSNYNSKFNIDLSGVDIGGKYRLTFLLVNSKNPYPVVKQLDFLIAVYNQVVNIDVSPTSYTGYKNDTFEFSVTYTGVDATQNVSEKTLSFSPESDFTVTKKGVTDTYIVKVKKAGSLVLNVKPADNAASKNIACTIAEYKADATKSINGLTLNRQYCENFNDRDILLSDWVTKGTNEDDTAKVLKRAYWRREALDVKNNCLEMHTKEAPTLNYFGKDDNWITGGIHCNKKDVFGYIEARVKMKKVSNAHWDAFWTYDNAGSGKTSPLYYEMDIMEYTGTGTTIDNTTHWWNTSYGKYFATRTYQTQSINSSTFTDWVTMGLYWSPEKVEYYYNGHKANGWTKDGVGIGNYSNLTLGSGVKSEIPVISKWRQQVKFTTELGVNYGGGRPPAGTDDIFYIDYFVSYALPVAEAEIVAPVNGTLAFDKIDNNLTSHNDNIASIGNKIWVTATPAIGYKVVSVKADGVEIQKDGGKYYYTVTEDSPKYWNYDTQTYGDTVKITAEFAVLSGQTEPTDFTLNKSADNIMVGETSTITVTNWLPATATEELKQVTFSVPVAQGTITSAGVFTPSKAGVATVTASYTGTTPFSKTIDVTVVEDIIRAGVRYAVHKKFDFSNNTDIAITATSPEITVDTANKNAKVKYTLVASNTNNNLEFSNLGTTWKFVEVTAKIDSVGPILKTPCHMCFWGTWEYMVLRNTKNGTLGSGYAFRLKSTHGADISPTIGNYHKYGLKITDTADTNYFFDITNQSTLTHATLTTPKNATDSFALYFNNNDAVPGRVEADLVIDSVIFYNVK